ncbi:MAG: DUF349 domain-containing protein [Flavobacteriaceae bacterium]|nr:DUF349 domain-containing protein [Flavobacteriaceae bacterium]MBL6684478.1 DUF349 domain-containing protein [Flavobacteriaceae bacterium]
MNNKNQNIEIKRNFELKTKLVEELKNLLNLNIDSKSKYEKFTKLKNNWLKIGKVPNHLVFGINNSYNHQVKVFYDFLYLDSEFKEKKQEENKKIREHIIEDALKIGKIADKLISYRKLLILIRKWNYLVGPVKAEDEDKLNLKFDSIINDIKKNKKEYLIDREKFENENLDRKKNILNELKELLVHLPNNKNEWIKLINICTKLKDNFINIGPLKLKENDQLWKDFKDLNRKFINEKNLFFKTLKKDYTLNINKQIKIINELNSYSETKELLDKKILIEIRNKFKSINNVPFKKNQKNWNSFNNLYQKCLEKIDSSKSNQNKLKNEITTKQKKLIDELFVNFKLEKLNIIIEKWIKIGDSNSQTESIRLIKNLEQKLKELNINDTENIVLNVKAKIFSEKKINEEKIKLRKKIEEFQKKISQLENNFNFIKGDPNNEIFSNVHSDINNYKNELKKLKKDFKIISKT